MTGILAHPLLSFSAFAVLCLTAAATDIARRRIPNWVVAGLLATAVVHQLLGGWPPGLAATGLFAGATVVLCGLYAAGLVGAGDVKMILACLLYVGTAAMAPFLLNTALFGGFLAFGYLGVGRLRGSGRQQSLPYGVAIAGAAILAAAAELPGSV